MWSNDGISRVLGALLIVAVAGCAPGEDPATAPPAPEAAAAPTPEMVDQGRSVFQGAGNCAVCHGSNARGGNLGPDLTDGTWIWLDPDSPTLWNDLADLIRSGIQDPEVYSAPMPAMGGGNLSDQQVDAVAAYVLSLN